MRVVIKDVYYLSKPLAIATPEDVVTEEELKALVSKDSIQISKSE